MACESAGGCDDEESDLNVTQAVQKVSIPLRSTGYGLSVSLHRVPSPCMPAASLPLPPQR